MKMIFAHLRTATPRTGFRRDLLPVLSVLGLLVLVMPWLQPANAAGSATNAAQHVADVETAIDKEEVQPIFGLPPIVVRVWDSSTSSSKTVTFKADIVFDEVDKSRIEDSMSVAKSILPRIMDSVITGIEGRHFEDLSDRAAMDKLVIHYVSEVLKPYGVVVIGLNARYFDH